MSVLHGILRWLGTLTLALLVSFITGSVVCFVLGVLLNANFELLAAFAMFALATLGTTAILAVVAVGARSPLLLDRAALAIVAASAVVLVIMSDTAMGWRDAGVLRRDLALIAETLGPIAAMVLIQWWLVRRRWRRENPA